MGGGGEGGVNCGAPGMYGLSAEEGSMKKTGKKKKEGTPLKVSPRVEFVGGDL